MLAREGVSLIDYNDYLTHCQAHKSGNHVIVLDGANGAPCGRLKEWRRQEFLKLHKALGVRCPTPDVFDLADEASKHDPGIADGLALQRVAMKVASDYFERMWPHEVEYGFHRQNVFISAWAVIDLYLNQLTAGKRFTMQGWALYISNQLAIHDYLWHRAAGASSFDKSLIGLRLMLLQAGAEYASWESFVARVHMNGMHVWGKHGQAWHQLPLDIRETAVLKWTHDAALLCDRLRCHKGRKGRKANVPTDLETLIDGDLKGRSTVPRRRKHKMSASVPLRPQLAEATEAERARLASYEAHLAASQAEAKVKEATRKERAAASRAAKRAAPENPYTVTRPQSGRAKTCGPRSRSLVEQLEHDVHVHPDQKALRAAAFDARQAREHLDAEARKAREKAAALKKIEVDMGKAEAVAEHVVPVASTLAAFVVE